MKISFILFILLFLSTNTLFAQHPYIPIPADSALWVTQIENWHEGEPGPPPPSFTYRIARFEGTDTVVNAKQYICYNGEWPPPLFFHLLDKLRQ